MLKLIWMGKKFDSPYLQHTSRLGDVIGAIQVLGSTPWHAIRKEHWEDFLGRASSTSNERWDEVLQQHPEFFRIEKNGDAALRWRFAYARDFDPRKVVEYSPEQRNALTDEEKNKLHRKPLSPEQIETLIKAAIELHARALARVQDLRWWIPLVVGLVTGVAAGLGFGGKARMDL